MDNDTYWKLSSLSGPPRFDLGHVKLSVTGPAGPATFKLNDIPATGTSNDIAGQSNELTSTGRIFYFKRNLKLLSLFNYTIFAVKRKTSSKA